VPDNKFDETLHKKLPKLVGTSASSGIHESLLNPPKP
jgi:hypothetical protein